MTDIQKRMMATFLTLRIGVGIIGIVFPILLWIGGRAAGVRLADSMSAYYHANRGCLDPKRPDTCPVGEEVKGTGPMRNYFVGILFIIGSVMYLMKGFSNLENWALNVAGVMALCVALFPMPWSLTARGFSVHGICAVAFFVCIAFVCAFCSDKTLKHMPQTPDRPKIIAFYKRWYRILAVIMLLSPLLAFIFNFISYQNSLHFFVEMFGIWAFGAYWLFKTAELRHSDVEQRALKGELDLNPKTLR